MENPWRLEKVRLRSGLNVNLARAGSGPLVVMLHGFPECWYSWRHQLRALAPSFQCVAPDLRGYGGTDAPRGVGHYALDRLVEDVVELIEAMGRRRAAVVGHDWGGAIAWATALKRPEVVERLVVMNCPHPAKFRAALIHNPRQMLRSWYILFFQIPWLPDALLRASGAAAVARALRETAVQKQAFSDEDLAYFRRAFRGTYSATAALNYYRSLFRSALLHPRRADAWIERKIEAPTMLVWGEQDVALGKELTYGMEPLFAGRLELRYVPDSGHWVQQEKPQLVNRFLSRFLETPTYEV
jgi:pimeloyl-ACP methyl ester carboxylesterase